MGWTDALKEYAKQTGKFVVPKKGTAEYEAVLKIQNKLKGIPDEAEVKAEKVKKERKKKEEDLIAQQQRAVEEAKKVAEDKLVAEAKAIQDAKDSKIAKREATKVAKLRLAEEKKRLEEEMKAKQEHHGKLEAQANTMKKLRVPVVSQDEIKQHEELSINKIAQRAERKIQKKTSAREPSFRIEDKKIIISFSE